MLTYIVPFLVRNVATTTLVSALSLVVTLYKFKLRRTKPRIPDKTSRTSKPMTWLSRCRSKSIPELDTEIARQTRIATIVCVILQQTCGMELQVQLCSLQDHITRLRRLLYAIDYCLGVVQERLVLVQRRLYTLGYGQSSPSFRSKSITMVKQKESVRSVPTINGRLLKMLRVNPKGQD